MPTIICGGKTVELIRKPIAEPATCPVCGHATGRRVLSGKAAKGEGAVTECKNGTCPARADARLKTWITKLDILGIGDELLPNLISEREVKTPADLYRLASEPTRMAFLPATKMGAGKLGLKRAQAIIEQINAKKVMPIYTFIGSLGIPHLGRRRAELIMEAVPGEFETIDDWLNTEKLRKFAAQASIPNIAGEMIAGIEAFRDEIDDLRQFITIVNPELKVEDNTPKAGPCVGMTFVLTGAMSKSRKEITAALEAAGGKVCGTITKGVNFLVQADSNSQSSKTVKAVKLGIKVISEDEMWQMLGAQ